MVRVLSQVRKGLSTGVLHRSAWPAEFVQPRGSARCKADTGGGRFSALNRQSACPLLRLPVVAGDILGIEMQDLAEGGRGCPFSTFVCQHQLEDWAERSV